MTTSVSDQLASTRTAKKPSVNRHIGEQSSLDCTSKLQRGRKRKGEEVIATEKHVGKDTGCSSGKGTAGRQRKGDERTRVLKAAVAAPSRPKAACKKPVLRGPLSKEYFFRFMVAREEVRIRKEIERSPVDEWYQQAEFPLMRTTRLNNVRREDDRTTRCLRRVCSEAAQLWHLGEHEVHLGRLLLLNIALWRAFGSIDFITSAGFRTDIVDWDEAAFGPTIETALKLWRDGQHAFTEAYHPARTFNSIEKQAWKAGDEEIILKRYWKTCQLLEPLWKSSELVVKVALMTRSCEKTTKCLMKVTGFGGTGFAAKEVVQDLLFTPLFQSWDPASSKFKSCCNDLSTWCIVGPGARRGLNRLLGREVDLLAYCPAAKTQEAFLVEMHKLFAARKRGGRWPSQIRGVTQPDLLLHDVQFSLCEFDKYERAKYREGRIRRFVPRCTADEEVTPPSSTCDAVDASTGGSSDHGRDNALKLGGLTVRGKGGSDSTASTSSSTADSSSSSSSD